MVQFLIQKTSKSFRWSNSKYKSYFNGSDLSQWIVPENNIWWIVDEKTLKVKSGPEQKGSVLWTKDEFEDFRVGSSLSLAQTVDSRIFYAWRRCA